MQEDQQEQQAVKDLAYYAQHLGELPDSIEEIDKLLGNQSDDEKSDEPDDEAPNAEEKKSDETPAPSSPETPVDENAPIESKNGKNTIPYAVLAGEREKRIRAEQATRELQQKIAEIEARSQNPNGGKTIEQTAQQSQEIGDLLPDDSLVQAAEDFPGTKPIIEYAKNLEGKLQKIVAEFNEVKAAENARRSNEEEAARAEIRAAVDANPTLRFWELKEPEKWRVAIEADSQLRGLPIHADLPIQERFAKVVSVVEAIYGVTELPPEFRAEADQKNVTDITGKVEAAIANAEQARTNPPRMLGEMLGGATPQTNEAEDFLNLSPQKMFAAFSKMNYGQLQDLGVLKMASTGSFTTEIPAGDPKAIKLFSVALCSQQQRRTGFLNNLIGPAPSKEEAFGKHKTQTSSGFPFVRITDLEEKGDKVSVDAFDVFGGEPVMGDDDAEGTGEALSSSSMEVRIDLTTKAGDVGGKMSRHRTLHDLRLLVFANLDGYFRRINDQTALVHVAGARGDETGREWIVPLQSSQNFPKIMINPVQAPTYNQHFVVDGTDLAKGGAQLGSVATTDKLTLDHIGALRVLLDEAEYPLLPVKLPDDPAAEDDPLYVLYLSPRQYGQLLAQMSEKSIRSFQQNAWNRASYGSKHPLFRGEVGMWNGIIVRKLPHTICFKSGSSTKIITAANAATATETTQEISTAITSAYRVDRGILLGAQALAIAQGTRLFGKELKRTGLPYNWNETPRNFGRSAKISGDMMDGKKKFRFDLDGTPTDHGVIALDSVVSL
jgi:N4-gp56 family major capsid protein